MKFNDIYNLELGFDDERSYQETHGYQHLASYEQVIELLKASDVHGRNLDIGCGSGYGSDILSEHGLTWGIDYSSKAIAYAQFHYQNPVFNCFEVPPLPFRDDFFDCVMSIDNFEHIEEDSAELYISEVARVLNEDGFFFISTPQSCSVRAEKFHKKHWTPDEIEPLLKKYFNFVNLEVKGVRIDAVCFEKKIP